MDKKYNMQDLPVFFVEHAEDLCGKSAETGGIGFLAAVAFLVEHNYGDFAYQKNESEEKAYKRYRMNRSTQQVTDIFENEDEGK